MSMGRGGGGSDYAVERLARTHRRIGAAASDLERAVAELDWQTIDEVIDFFSHQALRHHEDEEAVLFPALAGLPELAPLLADLGAEHAELAAALRALGDAVRAGEPSALRAAAAAMIEIERRHVTREDAELLPAAERALTPEQRTQLGEAMRARRLG